jgi:polyhydroxyalkanoate synthesis regulator phasin
MTADTEHLIDAVLEGAPRADVWQSLRQTLEARLSDVRLELTTAPESRGAALRKKVRELEQQVAALHQEEVITRFVEDSVRATVARPHPLELDDEY